MAQLKSTNITGNLSVTGNVLASKIIKLGGTTHEVLLADGTVAKVSTTAQTVAPNAVTATAARTYIVQKNGDQLVVNVPWVKGESSGGTLTQVNLVGGTGISLSSNTIDSDADSITINHSNSVTAVTTAGLYKVKYDAQGHITGTTAVAKADITGLGIPGSDTDTGATSIEVTGTGNAVTEASYDATARKITLTKGSTFLTSHQSLTDYVKGPASSTDTAIAVFDGTGGKTIKNSGATIDANRNLRFNGPGNISWEDGSYYQRIQITDDSTQNTAVFTFQQTEDTAKTWNDLFTIQDRGTIIAKNPTGGALSLTLDRGNNANWRWLSDNGNFIAQCDYTSAKGSYFNVLTMAYNTGNVSVDKGSLTSKSGFIHGNLTVATGKTKNDYILLAGGGTKALADFGLSNNTSFNPADYLPLAGGDMKGPIDFEDKANASGKNKNYISAGGGYGATSGKEGLKILALNQDNARMGLGVDLTGGSYELTLATGRADNNTASKIGFATHTTGTTAYKTLGYFTASGAENPTVVFNVAGTIQENGTALGDKYQSKDADLTAIAGLTGTSGFLKKTAADTWALETISIPAAQIQSDWNQTDNTKVDYIKNKPTIPTVPTGLISGTGAEDYLAVFDGENSITDSAVSHSSGVLDAVGYKMSNKATWQYNSSTDCVELVW